MPPVVERGEGGRILFSFGELRLDILLDIGVLQLAITANFTGGVSLITGPSEPDCSVRP